MTASKANLFEKYGLDVATVYLGGSTRIVQVMIAGDIQIGQIGGSAALFGKAAGADMAYIATTINSMAAQVMARPEIKQIIDLKGKALGVTRRGSNTDYWARFGLTHHGLVPDKDVKIVYTGGLRETYTALQQKQISAATMGLGNSFGKMLQREGFNTLIDISKLGEDFPFNGIATTKRYLQTKRPNVLIFMKAYLEAIKLNLESLNFERLMPFLGRFERFELFERLERANVLAFRQNGFDKPALIQFSDQAAIEKILGLCALGLGVLFLQLLDQARHAGNGRIRRNREI